MKKILSLVAFVPMLLLALCTISCGSDDDTPTPSTGGEGGGNTTAETPDVVLYTFTNAAADYASLELTEDSRYIIQRAQSSSPNKVRQYGDTKKATCLAPGAKAAHTRVSAYESMIVEGKFTKKDGSYILEGFGIATIVVKDKTATVTITENGKEAKVLTANMTIPTGKESDLTNKVCHSWKVTKIEVTSEGESTPIISGTPEQIEEQIEEGAPTEITVSKVGTYMIKYTYGEPEVAHWRWYDEAKAIMQYTWEYNATDINWDSRTDSGFCIISVDGNNAVVTEDIEEEGLTMVTYLTRTK